MTTLDKLVKQVGDSIQRNPFWNQRFYLWFQTEDTIGPGFFYRLLKKEVDDVRSALLFKRGASHEMYWDLAVLRATGCIDSDLPRL